MFRNDYGLRGTTIPLLILLLILVVFQIPAYSQSKPFQFAFVNPAQIHPEETHIIGLRLNLIYGKNVSVTGIDAGFVNHTTEGISKGIQQGFIGINDANYSGWQDNIINVTRKSFEGVQSGLYNTADQMTGLQFGFVNYARTLKGVQIGLLNIIKQGGAFPAFPIVNWSF
jgi:hypothetical protein